MSSPSRARQQHNILTDDDVDDGCHESQTWITLMSST